MKKQSNKCEPFFLLKSYWEASPSPKRRGGRGVRYVFFLLLLSITTHATILTVKQDGSGDYTKIQEAIDAAGMHDTVLVWPGTYYENLHIDAKPITLASLYLTTGDKQYMYETIIDGSTIQNSVIVADNFPTGSIGSICGFIIQGGDARNNETNFPQSYFGMGGGILLYNADQNIYYCIVQNNLAQVYGGGIKAHHSNVFMSGNIIRNNIAYFGGGGLWYYGGENLELDTICLNSIYCNHSIMGNDFFKHTSLQMLVFRVDTASTLSDNGYCIYNSDDFGSPVYDLELNANHAMIDQVEADVYVSPQGNNSNSGLTPDDPLKNIWYAMTKINPDTNNKRTVHVMPGTYSPSLSDEIFPINARNNSFLRGEDMKLCIIDAEENWFHYSCHPGSYGMKLKNLSFVNGNSITYLDHRFKPGSIDLASTYYNYTMENLCFENNFGLSSSACRLITADYMSLNNISAYENFGGQTIFLFYSDQLFRDAIKARNIIVSNNSYYLEGYGFIGAGFTVGVSYTTTTPLRASVANIQVCNNKVYDSWGGLEHLSTFSISGGINNITNVTLANNENENHLPGAYSTWENMTSRMYNSIFYNNEHPSIILGVNSPPTGPAGELYLDYSLVEQGLDDIWNQQNYNILHYGANNIEGNPLFTGTGENPYQLQAASPCINTGTPMYEEGMDPPYIKEENGKYILYTHDMDTIHLPATDLAGNPRIAYGRIDMGAYEFKDTTVGVRPVLPKYLGGEPKVQPNPFQESTLIKFTLLKKGNIKVLIHDLHGRLVKTLLDAWSVPCNFQMRWHADNDYGEKIPSGQYIITVFLEGKNVGSVKVRRW
nr:hypothetical protein [Bacteroidota bacterium]